MLSRDNAAFLLLAFLYGSSFWLIKLAERVVPPISVAALRLLIGAVVLHGISISKSQGNMHSPGSSYAAWIIIIVSLVNNVFPIVLISLSQQNLNPGISSIILSSSPIFTLLFSSLVQKQPINHRQALGVFLGFSGVVLLSCRSAANGGTSSEDGLTPYLYILLSAMSYAVANVFSSRFVGPLQLPLIVLAAWQVLSAALLTSLFSVATDYSNPPYGYLPHYVFFQEATWKTWVALLSLGVGSQAGVSILFFYLIQAVGPVRTSSVGYLVALVGFLEGVLFTDEWVGVPFNYRLLESVGGLVVLCGVWLASPSTPTDTTSSTPTPLPTDGSYAMMRDCPKDGSEN